MSQRLCENALTSGFFSCLTPTELSGREAERCAEVPDVVALAYEVDSVHDLDGQPPHCEIAALHYAEAAPKVTRAQSCRARMIDDAELWVIEAGTGIADRAAVCLRQFPRSHEERPTVLQAGGPRAMEFALLTYHSRDDKLTPFLDTATAVADPARVNMDASTVVNARVGVEFDGIGISVFAKNLFDSHARTSRNHDHPATTLFKDTSLRPRTIGVTATYQY